jgi:hypothetical protein
MNARTDGIVHPRRPCPLMSADYKCRGRTSDLHPPLRTRRAGPRVFSQEPGENPVGQRPNVFHTPARHKRPAFLRSLGANRDRSVDGWLLTTSHLHGFHDTCRNRTGRMRTITAHRGMDRRGFPRELVSGLDGRAIQLFSHLLKVRTIGDDMKRAQARLLVELGGSNRRFAASASLDRGNTLHTDIYSRIFPDSQGKDATVTKKRTLVSG